MKARETYSERKRTSRELQKQTNQIKRNLEANGQNYDQDVIQSEMIQKRINQLVHTLPISSQVKFSMDPLDLQRAMNSYVDLDQLPHQPLKRNVGWLSLPEQDVNSTLSLTEELERFSSYVGLTTEEESTRRRLLEDVTFAVRSKWPDARILPFGSYHAGLSIFLSDLDVSVILEPEEPPSANPNKKRRTGETETPRPNKHIRLDEAIDVEMPHLKTVKTVPLLEVIDLVSDQSDDKKPAAVATAKEEDTVEEEISWCIDTRSEAQIQQEQREQLQREQAEIQAQDQEEELETVTEVALDDPAKAVAVGSEAEVSMVTVDVVDEDGAEEGEIEVGTEAEADWLLESMISTQTHHLQGGDGAGDGDQEAERNSEGGEEKERVMLIEGDVEEVRVVEKKKRPVVMDDIYDDDNDDDDEDDGEDVIGHESDTESEEEGGGDSGKYQVSVSYDEDDSDTDEIEEDLDIQLAEDSDDDSSSGGDYDTSEFSNSDTPGNKKRKRRSLTAAELQDSLFFDSSPVLNNRRPNIFQTMAEEKQQRQELIERLKSLFTTIKSMGFVSRCECRLRARVPIINFHHVNALECDISLGLQAKDTVLLLQQLSNLPIFYEQLNQSDEMSTEVVPNHKTAAAIPGNVLSASPSVQASPVFKALFALSAFLKVLLHQLELDSPFTGGLGSFKLYVLILFHLQHHPEYVTETSYPNLGLLLLSFLKFFGSRNHLHANSVYRLGPKSTGSEKLRGTPNARRGGERRLSGDLEGGEGIEISFENHKKIDQVQAVFKQVYDILSNACKARYLLHSSSPAASGSDKDSDDDNDRSSDHSEGEESEDSDDYDSNSDSRSSGEESSGDERGANTGAGRAQQHRYSSSFLGLVLDTAALSRQRQSACAMAARYPALSLEQRHTHAQELLDHLQAQQAGPGGNIPGGKNAQSPYRVTIAHTADKAPTFAARLLTYPGPGLEFLSQASRQKRAQKYAPRYESRYESKGGYLGNKGARHSFGGVGSQLSYAQHSRGVVGREIQERYHHQGGQKRRYSEPGPAVAMVRERDAAPYKKQRRLEKRDHSGSAKTKSPAGGSKVVKGKDGSMVITGFAGGSSSSKPGSGGKKKATVVDLTGNGNGKGSASGSSSGGKKGGSANPFSYVPNTSPTTNNKNTSSSSRVKVSDGEKSFVLKGKALKKFQHKLSS